ncbi:RHS repeat-associated core domain-containing protein, partial [Leptospira wolffii]
KESGFYFYNARHYDASIARFVSADTIIDGEFDTQGWNRFSYVKGNPISIKDPTGHEAASKLPCISVCIDAKKSYSKGEVNKLVENDLLNEKNHEVANSVRKFLADSKKNAKEGNKQALAMPEKLVGSDYYYKLRHIDAENRGIKPPDYYMNYGDTYLNVFKNEVRPHLSESGKKWLDGAKKNLQIEMEKILKTKNIETDNGGETFKSLIYDSHIPAYEGAGLYKDTNLLEKIFIGATPRPSDGIFNADGIKQMGIIIGHYTQYELENISKYAP